MILSECIQLLLFSFLFLTHGVKDDTGATLVHKNGSNGVDDLKEERGGTERRRFEYLHTRMRERVLLLLCLWLFACVLSANHFFPVCVRVCVCDPVQSPQNPYPYGVENGSRSSGSHSVHRRTERGYEED